MIASKVLPAFYILDVEGEAANLDFILGQNFGIQRITLGSCDFNSDLDASSAGQTAIEFFVDNPALDIEASTEELDFNPEFFPSLPSLQITEEQRMLEELTLEKAEQLTRNGQVPIILTRHFDQLGDYVTTRLRCVGPNYKLKLRICVNPDSYLHEKSKVMEESIMGGLTAHREIKPISTIH